MPKIFHDPYKNLPPPTPLDKNKVKPDKLLETLNSVNEAIQFTVEFSDKESPFLDISIKRDNSDIWIDMYHKPADTQRCLPYSTSHPKHCLRYSICNG